MLQSMHDMLHDCVLRVRDVIRADAAGHDQGGGEEWEGAGEGGRERGRREGEDGGKGYRATCIESMPCEVCSSWTFVNRGTSRRSAARPLGDVDRPTVAQGNLLAVRSAILIWILHAVGAVWVVEQPVSSLLWHHPRLVAILAALPCYRWSMCMADFGAPTLKPTVLVSNVACLEELHEWSVPCARIVSCPALCIELGSLGVLGNRPGGTVQWSLGCPGCDAFADTTPLGAAADDASLGGRGGQSPVERWP